MWRRHYDRRMSAPSPRSVPSIGTSATATVLVDIAGVRLLTDPLLRNRVAHLRRAAKVDPAALRGIDAVLISHLHYDHLDLPSLQRLGREMPDRRAEGRGRVDPAQGGGARTSSSSRAGEQLEIGALTIRATRAMHDTGRLPFGVKADPLGYVIEGGGRRSTSRATPTSSTRWPSSRRSTSRCSRSGAGGRRWGRATWIRPAPPRRPRSSARASRSRSTGARTSRSTSASGAARRSSTHPRPLFARGAPRALPDDGAAGAPAGGVGDGERVAPAEQERLRRPCGSNGGSASGPMRSSRPGALERLVRRGRQPGELEGDPLRVEPRRSGPRASRPPSCRRG